MFERLKLTPSLYKAYPELELFNSDEERIAILKSFQRELKRKPLFWLFCVGLGGINGASVIISKLVVIPGIPRQALMFILPALLGASLGLGIQYAWRKPTQQHLRSQLVSRGVPICLHCGYDLRGQTEARCPECGRPFVLRTKEDTVTH